MLPRIAVPCSLQPEKVADSDQDIHTAMTPGRVRRDECGGGDSAGSDRKEATTGRSGFSWRTLSSSAVVCVHHFEHECVLD